MITALYVDKIHVWFKIANITHALPVPVYRQTDVTPKRVVVSRVYIIPLRDFVPEGTSCPGTTTGVNSRGGDSRRHDIFWWYHVYHEGEPEWTRSGAKVAPVSCKHPHSDTHDWKISFVMNHSSVCQRPERHCLKLVELYLSWNQLYIWGKLA